MKPFILETNSVASLIPGGPKIVDMLGFTRKLTLSVDQFLGKGQSVKTLLTPYGLAAGSFIFDNCEYIEYFLRSSKFPFQSFYYHFYRLNANFP